MDLLTTDGQFVVNFYVCSGDADPIEETESLESFWGELQQTSSKEHRAFGSERALSA
jgi:head-tail adaptor